MSSGYKSEKVKLRNQEVKDLVGQNTKHQADEAHNMGLSTSALHQKINPLDERYNLTLAEASLHSATKVFAQWLAETCGLTTIDPKVNAKALDGHVSDEICDLNVELSGIYKLMEKHRGYPQINVLLQHMERAKELVLQIEAEINNHK